VRTILLVDDEPDILFVLELLLRARGYHIVTARNGAEAIEAANAHLPDLVISDWMMPVMDGAQLYRCFQAIPILHGVPFVFMSAAVPPVEVTQGTYLKNRLIRSDCSSSLSAMFGVDRPGRSRSSA
jgi:CheY-like chemotaxis protein